MWGAVVSGTTYNTNNSSTPQNWSISGGTGSGNSYIGLTASSNYIQTDAFCQNGITSIRVKARTYSSPSDAQKLITIEWVPTSGSTITLGTLSPSSNSLSNYTLSSLSNTPTANTTGSIKISCKGASSSKGSGVSEVTITYTACASCETAPTVGTVTATAGNAQVEVTSKITALGDCNITDYGFVYGTSANPTGNKTSKGSSYTTANTTFSHTFGTLSNGTTYHFRAYVVMGGETYYSADQTATPVLPNYTVTFNAGTGTCGTTTFTQTANTRSVTLPTATPPTTCSGWSFAGWCTSSAGEAEDNNTSPGTILTGSYEPTSTITLYAVYTKDGEGSGNDEGYYVTRTLSVGKTYIFGAVKAAASSSLANNTTFGAVAFTNTYNTTSPNWAPRVDLTPNTSGYIAADNASITNACLWELVSISSGNYTFKNGSNYIYLGDAVGSTSNGAQCGVSTSAGKMYMDDVNSTCKDAFMLYNSSAKNDKLMVYNTGSSGYRMYNKSDRDGKHSNTMTPYVRFYEYDPGTTTYYMTSLVCCTPLGSINGSVSLAQLTTANPTKLKATWTMNAETGIDSYDLEIYDSNDNKVKTIEGYTSGDEITGLTPCTSYYAKLYTVSQGSPYCDGGLISTSTPVSTIGYTYGITKTNVSLKTGADEEASTCAGNFSAQYEAAAGYELPATLTVSGASAHTWSVSEGVGTLTINAANVTGNVSVTITATEVPCTPLDDPEVTVSGLGYPYDGVTLSWDAIDHADGYTVEIYNGEDLVESDDLDGGAESYSVSNTLAANTTYTYKVKATSETPATYCASNWATDDFDTEDYPTVTLYYSENGTLSEGVDQKILTDFDLDAPATDPCTKKFVGWSTVTVAETDAEPAMMAPGATYQIPTYANCTIYAVYASGGSVSHSVTQTTSEIVSENEYTVSTSGSEVCYTSIALDDYITLSTTGEANCGSFWGNNREWRLYQNKTGNAIITAASGYELTSVKFTFSASSNGTLLNGTSAMTSNTAVEASGTSATYSVGATSGTSGRIGITGIEVEYAEVVPYSGYATTCSAKAAKPTFLGINNNEDCDVAKSLAILCETGGASIYYTTDGSTPSSTNGTLYTTAIKLPAGSQTVKAIAVKAGMDDSDVATLTFTQPFSSISEFIASASTANTQKLVLTDAVVLGKTSNNIYVHDATGDIVLYNYTAANVPDWASEKVISGYVVGKKTTYDDMPEVTACDFSHATATETGSLPEATVISEATNANLCKLVKIEGVNFQSTALSDNSVTVLKGETPFTIHNSFGVLNQTLPNIATSCDVVGVLNKNGGVFRISPISVDGISTNEALAILPTFSTQGSTNSETPTAVAVNKIITVTPVAGMTSTYKDGTAAVADLTSATNVTIDADKAIVVTANAYYYTENSATYYYHADESLTEYAISPASISNGSVTIKKGNDVVSSATPTSVITLTATADPNYHFGSWDVYKTGTDPHEAVSVDANNQFSMPAAAVTVNVNFVENNKYTIAFTAGDADSGDVPTVDAKHANTSFEVPGKGNLVKEGYKFAGWKVGDDIYNPGDEFTTPNEVPAVVPTTITFEAQWVEGVDFTWDAVGASYSDQADLSGTVAADDYVSIVLDQSTSNNPPKWYNNGTAARIYQNNTVTISAIEGKLISEVIFNFTSGYTNTCGDKLTIDGTVGTWSGLTNEVVFTPTGTMRVTSITVTYINGTVTTLSIANVVMKKTDEPKDLEITCNKQNPTPEIEYVIAEADQQYASIAAGKVTALKVTPSPITVTANIAQGSNYTAVSTTFTITVTDRVHPNLSFDEEGYEADLNTAFDAPTLNKPNDITEANISYSSSETSVADVDASTGAITINAEGETTITATFSGDDKYDPQTVTYVLTVIDHTKDVLTAAKINQSSYGDWSKSFTSTVVFKGNTQTATATGHENEIQMRDNTNSGIVTTSNIGYLKNLSATASSNTKDHYLEVYGKTTPYTSAADLYDNTKCGIKIGTIGQNGGNMVWETGKAYTDKYWYIGVKSKTGALYYSDITFEWEPETLVTYNVTYSAGEGADGETVELHNIPAGAYTLAAKPADFEKTDKIFAGWKANGTGDILAAGSNYTLSADVEFVAYWSDVYTITYSAGEGADGEAVEIQNIPEGPYTLADKPNDFDKFGFTFAGWKANGEGETLAAGASYTVSGDVNFIAQWDALPVWVTTYSSNLAVGAEEYTIEIRNKNYEGQRYGTGDVTGVATIALREGAERLHFHAAGWGGTKDVTIVATMGETGLGSFGPLVKEAGVSGGGKTYTIATPNSEYYSIDLSSYTIEEGAEITFTASGNEKRFVLFGVNQEGGKVPVLDHLAFTGEATSLNYEAGDVFDPAGLGVNAIYTIGGVEQEPEAVAANQIEWSFDPAVLALETTEVSVTASYGGKSVSTTVENVVVVEPVPVITVSPASVNFGIVMQNSSVSARNITVTLKHIEAVTVTVNGSNVDAFDVQDNIASEGTISVVPTSTSTVGHFTATIKVKDNASETSKTISLTLDVEAPDDVRGSWTRVTNANDLEDGMKIVIAEHTESATADIKAMGRDKGNNRYAIESDLESSVLTPGEGASYFTLEALENNKFAIKTTGGKYLYAAGNGNNNYLKEKAELDNYGNWTISIANGIATILAQGDNANKLMRYNNSGDGLFSCYLDDSKQSPIAIYAKNVKITESGAADVPAGNDVEIEENITWTVTSDKEVGDLHMKDGAIIANSAKVEANDLYFKARHGKSNQIFDLSKITIVSNMYYDFQLCDGDVDADYWYSISVPFDVNLNDGVFQVGGTTPLVNHTDFEVWGYNTQKRATSQSNGWERVTDNMIHAGKAYLIGFNPGQPNIIRLKAAANWKEHLFSGTSMSVVATGSGDHDNWNGFANPTGRYIDVNKKTSVFNNNTHNWDSYDPAALSFNFVVGTAFFVQSADAMAISYTDHGNYRAPKREDDTECAYAVRITPDEATNFDNQIIVRASEDATGQYTQGHDMLTMNNATSKTAAMLWTENYGGKRLAIEEAAWLNGTASYVLKIYAPKAGTYSISVACPKENADLYLTYEGTIIWNLSESAYTMDLNKGTTNGYGLLLRAKVPAVVTGVDQIDAKAGAQKVIIDEHVYILRGGQIYGIDGKIVK